MLFRSRHLVAGTRGRVVYESGDPDHGIWAAGTVQGLIHDIPTVAALIHRIVDGAAQLITKRLYPLTEQATSV